ncbi:unnamed protein product [Closterium sp. NIES-65]|nr:unnamed protein product [Closterium sp. NIES-65]
MAHAWKGYRQYAWGMDELQPRTKTGANHFGGLGLTIVDSLDSLYLMGLTKEFNEAKSWVHPPSKSAPIPLLFLSFLPLPPLSASWVHEKLFFEHDYDANVFETTIRILGGLLSAYDLSGDPMLLAKAKELADKLLPAFTTPTGIPLAFVNLASGTSRSHGWTGSIGMGIPPPGKLQPAYSMRMCIPPPQMIIPASSTAHSPGWSGRSSLLADLGSAPLEMTALSQQSHHLVCSFHRIPVHAPIPLPQRSALLADLGSTQLEMVALSQRTGDPKYANAVRTFPPLPSPPSKHLPYPALPSSPLPSLHAPPLPSLHAPPLPPLHAPPLPSLHAPPLPSLHAPPLPSLHAPPLPSLHAPPLPP